MFEKFEQDGDKGVGSRLYALAAGNAGYLTARAAADAGVAHESALELDDLSDVIADVVHVTVPRAQRRKPIEGVVVHPTTFPVTKRQRRNVLGMPVTTVDRTLIDVLRA